MMQNESYLYVDTTDMFTVGILSQGFEWRYFDSCETKKSSAILHPAIYKACKEINLELSDIKTIFHAAGPGSYTGMRLSEGLCQIARWQGRDVYSFYHFEIPAWAGISKGRWFAPAFKGEVFVHEWDLEVKSEPSSRLMSKENFDVLSSEGESMSFKDTAKIIEQQPKVLFEKIQQLKLERPVYYYRPLEQEFSVNG